MVRGRVRGQTGARVVDHLIVDEVARQRDPHEVGLFSIEQKTEDDRWVMRETARSLKAAQERAWDLLTKEGGQVRVRQGGEVVAKGATCEPDAR